MFGLFKKLMPKVGNEAKEDAIQEKKLEGDECALCKKDGTDKSSMGQRWHTKCLRNAKKMAKKMI